MTTTYTLADGTPETIDGGSPSEVAAPIHLTAAGTSLVIDASGPRLPRIAHWGAALGDIGTDELRDIVRASIPPVVSNSIDEPAAVGVIAEPSTGWTGTPGLAGSRDGRAFAPLFTVDSVEVRDGTVSVHAVDPDAALALDLSIVLHASGLVALRARVTNTGDDVFGLDSVTLTLPVPVTAAELLDFTGRHLRERAPQRHDFVLGSYVRNGRRGRTGADATLLLLAGEPGFGFRAGRVWGVHTAWSGNHTTFAERNSEGTAIIGGGELLLSGEVRLPPGESYETPIVYGAHGDGMDELSAQFHGYLRSRPQHPTSPRKVALNTWEAVYFDHDLETLKALADGAAAVGMERYILDDGWFLGRRSDHAGLGDWVVDPEVWPQGLHPLVDHVRSLGLQFGLWFEPEMINVDSELARNHPDWIMSPGTRLPPEARHQQVLDLANPEAYAHILGQISSLVEEYAIDYIKWDHNRDLVDAGHPRAGVAGVHDQTLAVYALMDELKRRHPGLEIESCSSGGARADLGVLDRTERIWGSDCIDALERQSIQRWTGLILPPEMIGSHVGAPVAHTTGRTHGIDFRAGTALFGHFGVEWDVTSASETELAELSAWVETHKRFRPLLHSGTVVRSDHSDPAHWVHGVVAQDGSEALFAFVAMTTGAWAPPGRFVLPGLDPEARYDVGLLSPVPRNREHGLPVIPEWAADGVRMTGRTLGAVGLQAPAQQPEHLLLIHVRRVDGD